MSTSAQYTAANILLSQTFANRAADEADRARYEDFVADELDRAERDGELPEVLDCVLAYASKAGGFPDWIN